MGPVSGVEQKVEFLDDGKYREHDYIAKPDYHFEYGVEDPKTNVHQKRQETRLGDSVQGEYRCCAFKFIKFFMSDYHFQTITQIRIQH